MTHAELMAVILTGLGGFALGCATAWSYAGIEASKFIKEEGDRVQREFDAERDKRLATLCNLTDKVFGDPADRLSTLRASFDATRLAANTKRIDELVKALNDMTLMRDMLIQQVQSEGIEPVVLVTSKL
jgi:hypothetical protein